ncbi:aminotransferase class I/II-fold pyridoxal phosphate-dependent enzyme [Streptomyces sp. NPDC003038]|uniref:pyridoxal phosphate-dependent decarboxylase family protein n=1 Tax=unclassified Streptomyces TaxID=2593676 RepID=UPI0033A0EAEC
MDLQRWVREAVEAVEAWRGEFGPFTPHPAQHVGDEDFAEAFRRFSVRIRDNYPFFHPRYAGQMVKAPHPAAVVGYLAAMLVNPNNHAREGGPATADMEREVVAQLAAMFALPQHLGHLTSSGTIANLEALYVAREIHPGRGVAFSQDSHSSHARMCHVLGMPAYPVAVDEHGRMDLDALETVLRRHKPGTIVLTAGTTGVGAVDPIHQALELADRYGARIHVDAAYGGFFSLLAGSEGVDAQPWRAIGQCDSVTVDPHKHGLQPYGCGAVLFSDPAVARHFVHDSPYTYYTPATLHLGEISLECSRSGAAAAALWLTFQVLPPTPQGLGAILSASRRAAHQWADIIEQSQHLRLYQQPELDIVTFFPATDPATLSRIDAATRRLAETAAEDNLHLSQLRVSAEAFTRRHDVEPDAEHASILRSVLIKPEAETHLSVLHDLLGRRAAPIPTGAAS